MHEPTSRCGIPEPSGAACGEPVEVGAPLPLCREHLLVAADWVGRTAGVVDLLPAPCAACGAPLGVRYASGWLCAECEWPFGAVPDGELAPPVVEVVYYLRHREQIKIGTSASPRRRIAAIPHEEVLAFERGGRALERRRHEQFAGHRYPGTEWFAVHPALLEHVEGLRAGVDDPWAQYGRWLSRALALRA